jgi:hypothetical protein
MEKEDDLTQVQVQSLENDCTIVDEADVENYQPATLYALHGTKLMIVAEKGKKKGETILHFKCNYCKEKYFQAGVPKQ